MQWICAKPLSSSEHNGLATFAKKMNKEMLLILSGSAKTDEYRAFSVLENAG
jgi:hypothetical protein